MLWSLGEAAQTASRAVGDLGPGDPEVLRKFALDWLHHARRAFLGGYAEATAGSGIYAPGWEQARVIIELFELAAGIDALGAVLDEQTDSPEPAAAGLLTQLGDGQVMGSTR